MSKKAINNQSSNPYVCVKCGSPHVYNKTHQWCKKCYDHDYNTNRRDKSAERLRQALIRKRYFAQYVLARTKSNAKKEGIPFSLDVAWVKQELAKGKCAVTGMPLVKPTYTPGRRGVRNPWTPSIDRIDNTKGYTKGNCRIVVWMYNLAKNNYGDRDIVQMSITLTSNLLMKAQGKDTNNTLAQQIYGMCAGFVSS